MGVTAKSILIVDDEHDIRRFLSTILEDEGYHTTTACDGEQALQLLETLLPDLITLDVAMPNKSGVGTYRAIRGNRALAHIPVILITGVAPEFQEFISTRRQVPPPDGYLPKPVNPAELVALVERLLA